MNTQTPKTYCCTKVACDGSKYSIGGGFYIDCSRVATRDGYCTQHHPEAIAARRVESDQRRARKRAKQDRAARRKALGL